MFHKIPFSICSTYDISKQAVYADDENFLSPGSSVTFIKPPSNAAMYVLLAPVTAM